MIFIPGCAGFIGFSTTLHLLKNGYECVGVDNLNQYYDIRMKQKRLSILKEYKNFIFYESDIENYEALKLIFQMHKFDSIINLAARAGVRYSMQNPFVYFNTNTMGSLNLFELAVKFGVEKVVLASTSSLYAQEKMPFKEEYCVNKPLSVYAASKKQKKAHIVYKEFHKADVPATLADYSKIHSMLGWQPKVSIEEGIRKLCQWYIENEQFLKDISTKEQDQ